MIISWLKESFQANYAKEQITSLTDQAQSISFVSLAMYNGELSCSRLFDKNELRLCLQKAFNQHSAHDNNMIINNKRHIVTAIAGRQLENIALATIISAEEIEKQVKQTRTKMLFLSFVSLLLASGVVTALSQQFLNPIKQLSDAVVQIGKRNFTFKTDITTNDEFGDLGKVFNSTIEGMKELELGKIVQNALFPGEHFNNAGLQIFARTVTMTKLGGDYYDFFSLNARETGVFMGDVAGHGIPAALIMAMAKGTVLANQDKLNDPAKLLLAIHQTLFKLKRDKFKRMMTCQYLVFHSETEEFNLSNAGHCFPVIVGPGGQSSRFEEIISSPVGISKRANYSNYSFKLHAGETVILYSDGMLEATNNNGEIFGSNRFLDLARSCWHQDLKQYYTNLYSANSSWSTQADDDITIVLIRYTPETINV